MELKHTGIYEITILQRTGQKRKLGGGFNSRAKKKKRMVATGINVVLLLLLLIFVDFCDS